MQYANNPQKANIARSENCRTPEDQSLVKACNLPSGFRMIHPTPTDTATSDRSKMPEFEVCKATFGGRKINGNYCVFYTDYSLGSTGVETPPDISQIPELAAKKRRRRRRRGHRRPGQKGKGNGRRPRKPKRRPKKPQNDST